MSRQSKQSDPLPRNEVIDMAKATGFWVEGQGDLTDQLLDLLTKFAQVAHDRGAETERKHSQQLREDLDHFFQLSGRYLERANDAEDQVIELQSDAALGKILLRYIDRLIDPTPSDPLEKIVDEMIKEAMAAINTTGSKQ